MVKILGISIVEEDFLRGSLTGGRKKGLASRRKPQGKKNASEGDWKTSQGKGKNLNDSNTKASVAHHLRGQPQQGRRGNHMSGEDHTTRTGDRGMVKGHFRSVAPRTGLVGKR